MPRVKSATFMPLGTPRIGSIELDCALSETHTWRSSVTRVPVESGALRSQHIQHQPFELSIEAVISDQTFDFRKQQALLGVQIAGSAVDGYFETASGVLAKKNQAYSAINKAYARTINILGSDPLGAAALVAQAARLSAGPAEYSALDRLQVALSRLLELRQSDTPFEYLSPLGLVQNLVFQDFEVPVDQTSDLLFKARLVEFVETGVTRSSSLASGQVDASSEPANIGSRTTIPGNFDNSFTGQPGLLNTRG